MPNELLQKSHAYPLGDPLPGRPAGVALCNFGAVWTGEKRPVEAGEWYLSGSCITAYRAKARIDYPYHIARIVRVKHITTWEDWTPCPTHQ